MTVTLNMLKMLLVFPIYFWIHALFAQPQSLQNEKAVPVYHSQKAADWADSVLATMQIEQKVGQLMIVAGFPDANDSVRKALTHQVKDLHVGGVIWFKGSPASLIKAQNNIAELARIPLLTSMDAEWGVAMRMDSVSPLPRQMILGATADLLYAKQYGEELGAQCRALGIGMNYSPVVDVNNNPNNPVIGVRSFGQDAELVGKLGNEVFLGHHNQHVLACAKHFPGHGDTDTDSHHALPVIWKGKEDLEQMEWVPFRRLIKEGVPSIMIAHVDMPMITKQEGLPASFSPVVIKQILRKEMGFDGLVITDALMMKGAQIDTPGRLEVMALKAGNDVLLYPEDPEVAFHFILDAVKQGEITEARIDSSCRRILMAKYYTGLHRTRKIDKQMAMEQLYRWQAELLNRNIVRDAITLLANENDLLPLRRLDTVRFGVVTVGAKDAQWVDLIQRYAPVESHISTDRKLEDDEILRVEQQLRKANLIMINVHGYMRQTNDNYGVPYQTVKLINRLSRNKKVILNVLGSPYAMSRIFGIRYASVLINIPEDGAYQRDLIVQGIFGATGFKGVLPVDASARYKMGDGIVISGGIRMEYTLPEDLGIERGWLAKADEIAVEGIREGAYPGCQVLCAKDGKVFYARSFGSFTYKGDRAVKNSDLYDLASVTKIAATTAAVMKLTDEGKMSVDSLLAAYIPDITQGTPFHSVNIRHMMAHQAGLHPWIPFYTQTLKDNKPDPDVYANALTPQHSNRVAEGMFIDREYRKVILNRIVNSKLSSYRSYKYSDMGFYLLQEIIERKTGKPLNLYVHDAFYNPMGLHSLTYKPRERFPLSTIVPTEFDTIFRKQQLQGDVHDQGAAMLGGVAGHAGLFGNMYHLGAMMQMFCNYGTYGGDRYLQEASVKEFTAAQFASNRNRRGIGFDRPVPGRGPGPTCKSASDASFGHTGFTGITAWADPQTGIVYVFLSNRVYPVAENPKILTLGTRTRIQQVFYDAVSRSSKSQ